MKSYPETAEPEGKVDPIEAAAEAYRAHRRETRPFRRAFALPYGQRYRLARAAEATMAADAKRIREAVILGARDVATIATRVGLPQGRVRRVVRAERIRAVIA